MIKKPYIHPALRVIPLGLSVMKGKNENLLGIASEENPDKIGVKRFHDEEIGSLEEELEEEMENDSIEVDEEDAGF